MGQVHTSVSELALSLCVRIQTHAFYCAHDSRSASTACVYNQCADATETCCLRVPLKLIATAASIDVMCCRCLQTASFAAEGLGIQPQDWTVTCAVGEVRSLSCAAYIFSSRLEISGCMLTQLACLLALIVSLSCNAACLTIQVGVVMWMLSM